MLRTAVAACALAACTLAARPAAAGDGERPETGHLVLAGAAMAVPTYFLNIAIHEGTHAITAKAYGAQIVRMSLLPGRHPDSGKFYLGYVQYRGKLSLRQRTVFYLSPKFPDLVALGAYAALVGFDALPDNHYGQLALAVLATGFWVDFAKDAVVFWSDTDVSIAMDQHDLDTFWQRLPWRLLHAGVSVAGAYVVYQGYRRVFDDGDIDATAALITPVWQGTF